MKPYVQNSFQTAMFEKIPVLKENRPYRRLFLHLAFGTFLDKDSKNLLIPRTLIAKCFDRKIDTNYVAATDLESFRSNVLPKLTWSGYSLGNPREVLNRGFDAELQSLIDSEVSFLAGIEDRKDLVSFVTGKPWNQAERLKFAAEQLKEYQREALEFSLNQCQQKIYTYLRELDGSAIRKKMKANMSRIEEQVQLLPPESAAVQRRILHAMEADSRIHYAPSKQERTCRLFATFDSAPELKKEVRKALCHGWTDLDLRSSQFAIIAGILKAPLALAFLKTGKSLWTELAKCEQKKAVKHLVYSTAFGKSISNLKKEAAEANIAGVLDHPMIAELLALRGPWYADIKAKGGAHDAFGEWIAVEKKTQSSAERAPHAVAASVIQSYEMRLIEPVFDWFMKSGPSYQAKLYLFQHDGVTVSFSSKANKPLAIQALKDAVAKRAKELDFYITLESEDL